MTSSKLYTHPSFLHRIFSVWYRHMRVYTKYLITNGFPPFVEPLIFLFAIGLGLGKYITEMGGVPYVKFLASGLLVTASMYTAAFECSYGTYIRLEFDKVYDGMLAAPITANDLLMGEMLWAGTKGLFFSTAVLTVISIFGILSPKLFLVVPFIGFLTGVMFAAIALLVTSLVKNIHQFQFIILGTSLFKFYGNYFTNGFPRMFMFVVKEPIVFISSTMTVFHTITCTIFISSNCHLMWGCCSNKLIGFLKNFVIVFNIFFIGLTSIEFLK